MRPGIVMMLAGLMMLGGIAFWLHRDPASRIAFTPAPAPPRAVAPEAPPPLVADTPVPIAAAGTPLAVPPMANPAILTTDGVKTKLSWGVAYGTNDGMRVDLYSTPIDCAHHDPFTDNQLPGAHVYITVPSGPGAAYYAGHPTAFGIYVSNSGQAMDVPGQVTQLMGAQPFMALFNDAASLTTLEPFKQAVGSRVRGKVDADDATLIGAASIQGAFDVELCVDAVVEHPLKAAPPAGPARGRRGSKTYAPTYWQALVQTLPADRDEATDLAIHHRTHGSRAEIFRIVGYAKPVPCPTLADRQAANGAVLDLQGIGGASREHPVTGTPQPTMLSFLKAGGDLLDPEVVWSGAAVQLDELTFAPGGKIKGSVWAQSPDYDDLHGSFGGHFEAVVCDEP